jgi:hypothetical protein
MNPEIINECWQLLVEYIPRRDHDKAAEHLFSYLITVFDKSELEALAEMDSDLSEAYKNTVEDDEEDYNKYEDGEDE